MTSGRNRYAYVFEVLEEVGNGFPLTIGEDIIIQAVAGFACRVPLALYCTHDICINGSARKALHTSAARGTRSAHGCWGTRIDLPSTAMYNRKDGRFWVLVSRSGDGDDCCGMPGKSKAPRCYCSGSGRRSVVPWSVVVGSRIGRSTTNWTVGRRGSGRLRGQRERSEINDTNDQNPRSQSRPGTELGVMAKWVIMECEKPMFL